MMRYEEAFFPCPDARAVSMVFSRGIDLFTANSPAVVQS
jgi:hypothetical protein